MGSTLSVDNIIEKTTNAGVKIPEHIIQTQVTTYNTYGSYNSTSAIPTGLSVSITPKYNNSTILVTFSLAGLTSFTGGGSNATSLYIYLYKNGSNLAQMDDHWGYTNSLANLTGSATYSYMDSPATTSAVTYAVYFKGQTSNQLIAINNYMNNNGGSRSTIIAQEMAQ